MSSMQFLFGSDSDNSDNEKKVQTDEAEAEELPSTQAHMEELFGESDEHEEDDVKQQPESDKGSSDSSSDDEIAPVAQQSALNAQNDRVEEQDLDFSGNESEEAGPSRNIEEVVANAIAGSDDADDNNEKEKLMPTTQDLFGEELDVSSDEDAEEESAKPSIEEEERKEKVVEQPPTPEKEEEEGLSIAIELPRCNISLGKELYFIKLPNFLSVDTKPFDPQYYEDEIDDDDVMDEEGRTRLKLKVENTIRWRYSKDKDGNEIKESNCRFVRWSDGSLSMHLGNEVFDVFKMPIQGEQNHLFVQQGTGLQAQAVFKNKLSFRPHSTTSQTHRKMTMSIADRMAKAQKIKMMPAMERDPETQRVSMMKKEDERLRAASRRESIQRRMREKRHLKELSSSYVENDDDDEDFDESLSALKTKYGKDIKSARSKPFSEVYSDEGSDYDESKLRNAKLDIESDEDDDDDDDDIKRKKEELTKKKKLGRKVIEESEEESD